MHHPPPPADVSELPHEKMNVQTCYFQKKTDCGDIRAFFGGLVFGAKFEDVGRLAVEGCADCVECVEADGLSLAGFEDGEVGLSDANASGQNIAIATLTTQKIWLA